MEGGGVEVGVQLRFKEQKSAIFFFSPSYEERKGQGRRDIPRQGNTDTSGCTASVSGRPPDNDTTDHAKSYYVSAEEMVACISPELLQ